jgi:putative tricarboxylic transport membrane protein
MGWLDYVIMGLQAVFLGPEAFSVLGMPVSVTVVMVAAGLITGVIVGATPGLAGPMAMAIALPILIACFGYSVDALLPVLGFLIGIMKGATLGGAVPAILFNTPGTPDAFMTTLDGHPMARRGEAKRALRVAHVSSVTGDTASDIVLVLCAPFLALLVEAYLFLPEKTALLILSLTFIAAVIGKSLARGLIAMGLGLLVAAVGTGQDFDPRLTFGIAPLANGFALEAVILGVLILGEVFARIEDMMRARRTDRPEALALPPQQPGRLRLADLRNLAPYVVVFSVIGTVIGALPGIGSTLAATLGYAAGRRIHASRAAPDARPFGEGAPEGLAATEAANSSVSGANLIPVLSLGIPGNAAAVFLILAAESIGGFNPGPAVFRMPETGINPELVIAFGIFAIMFLANFLSWTLGGGLMRAAGVLVRVPLPVLMPAVLLLTLTAIHVQSPQMSSIVIALGFGVLGWLLRRLGISPLPFVIAFILAAPLERTARQAFSATGGDPWFLFSSATSTGLMATAGVVVVATIFLRQRH